MTDFKGYLPIVQEFLRIESQFESLERFKLKSVHDFQISSFVTRSLNVLICRTIEGSIKNIVYTRAVIRGFDQTKLESLENNLKYFRTPNWTDIQELFKKELEINLDSDFLGEDKESLLRSLSEILKERHNIAHSTPQLETVSINKTIPQIKTHFDNIKKLIEKICNKIEEIETTSISTIQDSDKTLQL